MAGTNIDRLRETLDELFMFDRADLDFGLYRIMNVRREEIRRFLDHDLLPKVRTALGQMQEGGRAATEAEMRALEKSLRDAGVDPASSPKFRELEVEYHAGGDTAADEADVYGHLVSFFRRYYKEGDFISLRRYKEGVYAIPYEGEEVKLHWANADQYYIKSTEQFRDYTFVASHEGEPERRVHFRLFDADTERNDNRAPAGQDRRFVLSEADPVAEVDGELVVRFEYRSADGAKQDALSGAAEATVLADPAAQTWCAALSRDVRGEGAKEALTFLRKHINTYAAKNTFDYFIHKDLRSFLRRELDFYIKNEVLRLDDIDTPEATSGTLDAQLRKVKAIRAVGLPIIEFLASLEEFQKRLWLKKKFVVETHWCVTLDRVPRELYPDVAANDRQREEWVRLFAINEIKGDMVTPGYAGLLTDAFLEANQYLVVDTSLFSGDFTERLLATIEDLDEATDGLLVHGENFQALNLLGEGHREQITGIYIDPPYNTDGSPIAYKNGYRESSWVALIDERVRLSKQFLRPNGVLCATIDDYQSKELGYLLEATFGKDSMLGVVTIRINPSGRITRDGLAVTHEYAYFAGNSEEAALQKIPRTEEQSRRFKGADDTGVFEWRNFRREGSASERGARPRRFFPLYCKDGRVRIPNLMWDDRRRAYDVMEEPLPDEIVCWPRDSAGTERVWRWGIERAAAYPQELEARFGRDGDLQIYYKYRPGDEGVLAPSVWTDAKYSATEHGTGTLKNLFGERNSFSFPKSVYATADCVRLIGLADEDGTVLDYFAGSGTTAHAVIHLNREDGGQRKYILVEMGEYFDTVLKPRVLKAIYSKDWKDGKPVGREGVSQLIKVIRLESYEDTLTNLRVEQTQQQTRLLDRPANERFREQYALRYWITEETRGSASLLDLERFEDPWSYTLEVGQGSAAETKPVTVDLVETFNYLLGLRVQHVDHIRGVTLVQGTLPPGPGKATGEKALVIWRNTQEMDAEALEKFLWGQRINPRDLEFDVIYVNGDNHLENSRRLDETWKVRLIEDEFHRLMFEAAEQERRQ